MDQPRHRVTIIIDTDDNKTFSELLRCLYGLQRILRPDIEMDFATELNETLIEAEQKADKDELPF